MEKPIRRRPARRKRKKVNKKLIWIAAASAAVLITIVCLLLCGNDAPQNQDPERGPLKELTVGVMERQGETVVVETSYGAVKFPYAFSDLISVEALNQEKQTALIFTARIGGQPEKIYTIWFNGSEGAAAGTMDLNDGETPVQVTLVFHEPNVTGEDLTTFYATQETVNDVLASLQEGGSFTPVK